MIFKSQKKDILENLFGLLITFFLIFLLINWLDFSNLQEKISMAGAWAPIILILAKACTIVFAPLSGSPLYPLAGVFFGLGPGLTYIVIGDMIGSAISFGISRKFGQRIVQKFLAQKNIPTAEKIVKLMESTKGFLFARICFSPMPEIISYAAGLTRISFTKFFIIHNIVGLFPSFVLVWSGDLVVSYLNHSFILIILGVGTFAVLLGSILFWKYSTYFEK